MYIAKKELRQAKEFAREVLGESGISDEYAEALSKTLSFRLYLLRSALRELGWVLAEHRRDFVNFLVIVVVGVSFVGGTTWVLMNALEREEVGKCEALAKQAKEYPLWYATPVEREMCAAHNMELPPDNTAYPDGQPWPYSN